MVEYIHNIDELLNINTHGIYELTDDIDCKGLSIARIIYDFSGEINGEGHVIKNLVLSDGIWGDEQTLALFTNMSKAKVRNISFENMVIKYEKGCYTPRVGALAGLCEDSRIENIYFSVSNDFDNVIPLIYDSCNSKILNTIIICNGKEAPISKYN